MKDNFSTQSAEYALFRPGYPLPLLKQICQLCSGFDNAWDCATGNGQIAAVLSEHFRQVEATDISENQLKNAIQKPNIRYQVAAAETPLFPLGMFDLVIVGQAAHWFDLEKFYPEVRRVLKPGGILALIGYNLLKIDTATDAVVQHLYSDVLGKYWDAERHLIETAYTTIPFPFPEIDFYETAMYYEWSFDQLLGFLRTWSAVQHFTRKHEFSPITESFIADLRATWPENNLKTVQFPVFGRLGRSV